MKRKLIGLLFVILLASCFLGVRLLGSTTLDDDDVLVKEDLGTHLSYNTTLTPSGDYIVQAPACMFLSSAQSGIVDEIIGAWRSNGQNDIVYLFLSPFVPRQINGSPVLLYSIQIFYYTYNLATDYIDATILDERTLDFSPYETLYLDGIDHGKNESKINNNYTILINETLRNPEVGYWVLLLEVVSNQRVDIVGLSIVYRLE